MANEKLQAHLGTRHLWQRLSHVKRVWQINDDIYKNIVINIYKFTRQPGTFGEATTGKLFDTNQPGTARSVVVDDFFLTVNHYPNFLGFPPKS